MRVLLLMLLMKGKTMVSYDAVQFIVGLVTFIMVALSLLYLLRETWWRQFVEDVRSQSYDEGWDAAIAFMQAKSNMPESNENKKEATRHA